MLVVCGGVPDGDGLAVGDGATVLVVCGWLPEGEALASGVTVAVGAGEDCSGVTVAVGRGPAGTLGFRRAVGLGSASVCATTCVTVSERTVAPTIPNAILDPKGLFFFMRIRLVTPNPALAHLLPLFLEDSRITRIGICACLRRRRIESTFATGHGHTAAGVKARFLASWMLSVGPIRLARRTGC